MPEFGSLRLVAPPTQATLPHSEETERAVLGAILLDPHMLNEVSEVLRPEHFYGERHQILFAVYLALAAAGSPIDDRTVQAALESSAQLETIGGIAYLAQLDLDLPSRGLDDVRHYVAILLDRAARRAIIEVSTQAIRDATDGGAPAAEVLTEAQSRLRAAGDLLRALDPLPGFRQAAHAIEDVTAPETREGLSTGMADVDRHLVRLLYKHSYFVGGRPSHGKTAWGLQVGMYVAANLHRPVGFISLEMPRVELQARMLSHAGRIDYRRLQGGRLDSQALAMVRDTSNDISALPFWIDDTPGLTTGEIVRRVRRLHKEHGCALVILDFLGLVKLPASQRRHDLLVGEVATEIDNLAKELGFCFLAMCQLNQRCLTEKRRPQAGDLRDSDILLQVGQAVLFVHRDTAPEDPGALAETGAIIIAKARNGTTGTVPARFDGKWQTWQAIDDRREEPGW